MTFGEGYEIFRSWKGNKVIHDLGQKSPSYEGHKSPSLKDKNKGTKKER